MENTYVRRRSVRDASQNKNKANTSEYKLVNNIIRQTIICCVIFVIITSIKNINTPFTSAVAGRITSVLQYTVNVDNAYKSVLTFAGKSGLANANKISANSADKMNDIEREGGDGNIVAAMTGSLSLEPFEKRPSIEEGEVKVPTDIIPPVSGQITSKFGTRIHPLFDKELFHSGVDIDAPKGTLVKSVLDGEIVKAEKDGTYGKFVKIKHSQDLYSVYAHLNEIDVKVGQKVNKADTIGKLGDSGKTTGVHLHFELWKSDKVLDPMRYIHFDGGGEK